MSSGSTPNIPPQGKTVHLREACFILLLFNQHLYLSAWKKIVCFIPTLKKCCVFQCIVLHYGIVYFLRASHCNWKDHCIYPKCKLFKQKVHFTIQRFHFHLGSSICKKNTCSRDQYIWRHLVFSDNAASHEDPRRHSFFRAGHYEMDEMI